MSQLLCIPTGVFFLWVFCPLLLQVYCDLGELPVVIERGPLPDFLVSEALDAAEQYAQKLIKTGLIDDAYIACAGQIRVARGKGLQITDKI